jgi:hypothetical protein
MDEQIQRFAGRGMMMGMNDEQIRARLLPQIAKPVQQEGGLGMYQGEALRQASEILDSGMKGFGQKLYNAASQMEEAQQKPPVLVGIKEYAEKLQEAVGGDIPQKQLDVLEQILQQLAKSRPELVQAQMGSVFQ